MIHNNVTFYRIFKRFGLILFLLLTLIVIYSTDLHKEFSFKVLKEQHKAFKELSKDSPFLAPLIFSLVYIVCVALSLPVGIFLSLLGGYLFPQPLSTILVVISATCGAMIIFLAAKTAIGNFLRKKIAHFIPKVEKGFRINAVNYLLFLRFAPLIPFWAINIVSAFFQISLWTFVWTTAIGIIPGTLALTLAGSGIEEAVTMHPEITLSGFLNNKMISSLILSSILALFSLYLIKKKKKKFHGN